MNTIISLNWNTTDLLINMFESACATACRQFKTVIVDNGSRKEEHEKLVNYFSEKQDVVLKSLHKNVGFAAGNNIGLSLIKKSDLVFFINSDIVIEESGWDLKYEILFKENVGIIGCAYHPIKWNKLGRFQIQEKTDCPLESESVQGAFFSIPFNLLLEVQKKDGFLFDENFKFAHYEETDLQFRIMKMGYKCIWFPLLHTHLHSKSATKSNGYKLSDEIQNEQQFKANSEKNRQLLYNKHIDFFRKK